MKNQDLLCDPDPWSIIAFQHLRFTIVASGKLPKKLGPRAYIYQTYSSVGPLVVEIEDVAKGCPLPDTPPKSNRNNEINWVARRYFL